MLERESRRSLVYVEPFVGAGAVLFWVLEQYPDLKQAVINDNNPDLINVYRTIQTDVEGMIRRLKKLESDYLKLDQDARKDFYLNQRDRYNANRSLDARRAALTIFLNKTGFNGLYRVNSSGIYNVPAGKYDSPLICDEPLLRRVHEALQKVVILCGDFGQTLEYAQPGCIFYFDPPYRPLSKTANFTSYTSLGFSDDDQRRLKQFCDVLTENGYDWILSNSDSPDGFFQDLYSNYLQKTVYARRAVNSNAEKRGPQSELLITGQLVCKPYKYTCEQLLRLPEYDALVRGYCGPDEVYPYRKVAADIAHTFRYRPNIFYHATGGIGESGLGRGLYLGRDRLALTNFYNQDGTAGDIEEYLGNPRFLDLTEPDQWDEFEQLAEKQFGQRDDNSQFELLTRKQGFDGIRYFDPNTTGEEYVLYNVDCVRRIESKVEQLSFWNEEE